MNVNTAKGDSIEVLLRQIGATQITKVRGILYFIKFKLNEKVELSYVYNINAKNKYFLQRIKPYPITQGIFTDEYEIVSFIKEDLSKFNNVQNRNTFDSFLDLNNKIINTADNLENLFLNYVVNDDDFSKLDKSLNDILYLIENIETNSKQDL
ncbi:hypothetical protein CHF27_006420 [Romboutsia maritimum]|uniref:Uncharacterized protein n=1 Tax=Romboutsia maritimum TaxID=2020948 RepID=A0A371ITE5_9FIRM|nr:hypothetical protein [Romboutsia maritimum]RDY23754.1 hypothetical protein CHF27_006420 [Romboutsia maritimum]